MTAILSTWFRDNSIQVNAEKCYLMFFSNTKSTSIEIKINNAVIHESLEEKWFSITFDLRNFISVNVFHSIYLYRKCKIYVLLVAF